MTRTEFHVGSRRQKCRTAREKTVWANSMTPIEFGHDLFRVVFFLWRLVWDGERAGPRANRPLGAKHGGRPPIVSHIIVHEYCALWVFPDCSTAMFYFGFAAI